MSNDYSVHKNNSPVIIPGLDNNNPCPSPLTWAESETIERTGTGAQCSPLKLEIKETAFEKSPISVNGVGTLFSNDMLNGTGSAAGQNITGNSTMSILLGLNAGNNANVIALSVALGLFAGLNAGLLINSVLFGAYAGENATNLQATVAIGTGAAKNSEATIINGIFLGTRAGYGINGVDLFSNLIGIGNEAGSGLVAASLGNDNSILIGNAAGKNGTDFKDSIAIGYNAASPSWNLLESTYIGKNAGVNAWNNNNMIALGTNAGNGAYESFDVIAIGTNAGRDGFEEAEVGNYSILIGRNTSSSGKKNSILLGGSTHASNYVSNTKDNQFMLAPNITSLRWRGIDYELPENQAEENALLTNDGEGNLSWQSGYAASLLTPGNIPIIGEDGKLTDNGNIIWNGENSRLQIIGSAFIQDNTGVTIRQRTFDGAGMGLIIQSLFGAEEGGIKVYPSTAPNVRVGAFNASRSLAFYSGNTEAMRIDTSGNVGVGTSTPSNALTVLATGSAVARFENTATAAGNAAAIQLVAGGSNNAGFQYYHGSTFRWELGQAGTNGFALYNAATSNYAFMVDRTTSAITHYGDGDIILRRNNENIYKGISFTNSGGTERAFVKLHAGNGEFRIGGGGGGYWPTFYAQGAEVMRINVGGLVGIGTTDPQYKLDVSTTGPIAARFKGTTATSQTGYYIENDLSGFSSYGGVVYGGSTSSLGNIFGASRANKMFVFADGSSNAGMVIGTLSNQSLQFGTNNTIRITVDNVGKTSFLSHLNFTNNVQPTSPVNGDFWFGSNDVYGAPVLNLRTGNTNYVIPIHQNSGGGIMSIINLGVGGNALIGGYLRAGVSSHQGAHIIAGASTATRASMHLTNGVAITSPVDGDIWRVGNEIYIRLGGATFTLNKTAV